MSVQRIIGLAFSTRAEADAALATALQLQERELLRLHDSAVIVWDASGHGEVPAPFTAVAGRLQELAKPGEPILALLVSDLAGMAVIEELRRFRNVPVIYLAA